MEYSFSFEIAALIFMGVVLLHFIFSRQFPVKKTRIFLAFLLCSVAVCITNIASSICISHGQTVPLWINGALALAYFALQGVCYFLFYTYLSVLCDKSVKVKKYITAVGIVMLVIYEIFVIITPLTGFFFYFKNGEYFRGSGADFGYIYIILFLVLNIFLIILCFKSIKKNSKLVIFCYLFIAIAAIVIQAFNKEILLTGFTQSMVILMMYLAIQNPGAMISSITGLADAAAFDVEISNIIGLKKKIYIISIDIRQFHNVNAVFGYNNGNKVLEMIGSYLFEIAGKFHIFHMSGDMYNIVVETNRRPDIIIGIINSRFSRPWYIANTELMLNPVMTVCSYPNDFKSCEEFTGLRNHMLGIVKKSDVNYLWADEHIVEQYNKKANIELALKKALDKKQLIVYYQPIYSVKTGKFKAFEALSRIIDDEMGFIPPDEFILMAEYNGTIVELTNQVLEKCCNFIHKYVITEQIVHIDNIHVNISAVQCMQKNMASDIISILKKYNVPGKYICLEITEHAVISNPNMMLIHMKDLMDYGITFALDDYGTGNSNISYLINFPVEKVKFDKNVVWSYFSNPSARLILDKEFEIVHSLGIRIVAEGVEEREQAHAMESVGIEEIQGYYYGKPMPEEECLMFVQKNENIVP